MRKPLLLAAVLTLAARQIMATDSFQIVPLPPAQIPPSPQAPAPPARPVAPPATDIHELLFDGTVDTLKKSTPRPVTTENGYDNQPFFTPDGLAILFTSNRGGTQTDIFEFDRKSRQVRRVISTPESEYSPAITADGEAISVIRVEADATQRLWRFDRSGNAPRLVLADIKPVGYHAWVDADQLALFVLGTPSTLQHARVSTGTARVVAENIGRSLHRIPQTRAVSFVHRDAPGEAWVKQFDTVSGAITRLVRLKSDSGEADVAWTPDGTLLLSAGTKILSWRRGEDGWREVYDNAPHSPGAITRMAVAPDGRALAIVVNEAGR